MQRYYKILDIEPSATLEEIKTQYRQLVRIYHPDRFGNDKDRSYAEEKLKAINEAYNALVRNRKQYSSLFRGDWSLGDEDSQPTELSLEPEHIDFGEVVRGETLSQRIAVQGSGGDFQNLKFTLSQPRSFFSIERRQLSQKQQTLPAEIQLKLHTTKLEPDVIHSGWVEAELNGVISRTSFFVYVKPATVFGLSPRWATAIAAIILLLSVAIAGPLIPQLRGVWPIASNAAAYQPSPNQIVFTAAQSSGAELLAISPNGTAQQALNLSGFQPIWSPASDQMAYMTLENGLEQLHLFDSESGRSTILTQSQLQKSEPIWSTDGTHIAYIDSDVERDRIQLLSIASQTPRTIYEAASGEITQIDWLAADDALLVETRSNNASEILRITESGTAELFTRQASNGFDVHHESGRVALSTDNGIFLFNSQGNPISQLTTFDASTPKWSADGVSLAFLSRSGEATDANLWTINADGSGLTRLTTMRCLDYFWSPDDRYIAYITGNAGDDSSVLYLWVVEISNNQSTLVAEISEPHVTWSR